MYIFPRLKTIVFTYKTKVKGLSGRRFTLASFKVRTFSTASRIVTVVQGVQIVFPLWRLLARLFLSLLIPCPQRPPGAQAASRPV